MSYEKYFDVVIDSVIGEDPDNDTAFLNPFYKYVLKKQGLTPDTVEDYYLSWDELEDTLKLIVDKINRKRDNSKNVFDWLYYMIFTKIQPTVTEIENKYLDDFFNYLKHKMDNNNKENKETKEIEKSNEKNEIKSKFGNMNFTKKDN